MPTQKKIEAVEYLREVLARSSVVIGADYRGLRVAEITALRQQLRDVGVEMHVIKNTLFKRATDAIGQPDMAQVAEGPTALVIGFDDPIAPIKQLVEYQRTARNSFAARSAYMEGQVFPANRLADLAALPPKNDLIAQFAGAIASPIATFTYLLDATLQEFVGLVDAVAEKQGAAA
jgi:large subunit ribosomal protein L10